MRTCATTGAHHPGAHQDNVATSAQGSMLGEFHLYDTSVVRGALVACAAVLAVSALALLE